MEHFDHLRAAYRYENIAIGLLAIAVGLVGLLITQTRHTLPPPPQVGGPIVRISAQVSENTGSLCSGVVLSDHLILTAAHCVYDYKTQKMYKKVEVKSENTHTVRPIQSIYLYDKFDQAALFGDFSGFGKLSPGKLQRARQYAEIFTMCGYPNNSRLICIPVQYYSIEQDLSQNYLWTMVGNSRLIPGMSGGPVIAQDGTVVGVNNGYDPQRPNVSYISPLLDMVHGMEGK